MAKQAPQTRKWEPREMRLVSEYIVKYYPDDPHWTRVRLGATHPDLLPEKLSDEEKRMLTVWKRWADAIVVTKKKLILIEGAILPDPGDVSKLLLYEYLLRVTPEFTDYMDRDIEKQLVISVEDPVLSKIARATGIKVITFAPDWISDYIRSLAQRKQRAALTYPSE
jgi:hypothetical protein